MEVIDTLQHTNYSFRFRYTNTPVDTFYNLIVGKTPEGENKTPYVLKYVCDESQLDEYIANNFDFRFFKGKAIHKYTDFFSVGSILKAGSDCPTNTDENGKPIPCEEITIIGNDNNSNSDNTQDGGNTGGGDGPNTGGEPNDSGGTTGNTNNDSGGGTDSNGSGSNNSDSDGTSEGGGGLCFVQYDTFDANGDYYSTISGYVDCDSGGQANSESTTTVTSKSGNDCPECIVPIGPIGVLVDIDLEEDLPCKTSKEDLKKVFPDASDEILTKLAGILNKFGKDFGIDNKEKLQHFLAQAGHETGDFDFIAGEESLYYTTSTRLLTIYGKYFSNTDTINKRKPDNYLRNSSKVADYVYCCRMGNGDEASGDGYKYRGRGVFQLTGKNNYTNFKTFYNKKYNPDKDFITDPELLKTNDTVAVISALWFYKKNVLDKITIDSITSVKKITKKINGGTNGLKDRKKIFNKAKDSINCN